MPARNLDAVFFSEYAPEVALRDGVVHIVYAIGQCQFEVVLPPHVFLKALRNCNHLAAEITSGAKVIPLRGGDPAVSGEEDAASGTH